MNEPEIMGQVVGGGFGDILIRQKDGVDLEIGDLLVSEEDNSFLILQVFALEYGSQIQSRMQQMMSGVNLEHVVDASLYEPEFVNYVLARIKPLARISHQDWSVKIPKSLPPFFNKLRMINNNDLKFLQKNKDSVLVGHIRSGSKVIQEAEVWLPVEDTFSHHVLIPATTGRGKSNLVKTMLWHILDTNKVGALVLDAHDEYYGRTGKGLKDHACAMHNLAYYTPSNQPPGAHSLVINLGSITPDHFVGIIDLTDAQSQAIKQMYWEHKEKWIQATMDEENKPKGVKPQTLTVVRRKLSLTLGIKLTGDRLVSRHKVFAPTSGVHTVEDIVGHIEQGKVVVMDTSHLGDDAELLVGNIVASRLLDKYKYAKSEGLLDTKPVVTIVIEEAARVIAEDVLTSKHDNIYSIIAKEGRKFRVGLTAVTQLSSVIPKTILANMNTKIILGNEMRQERESLIASASQDLSDDSRNIASLDKGEAIITSIFVPFAMPIKIPIFDELAQKKAVGYGKTKVF